MEHPDLQHQRLKADARFSDAETDDILKRAAEIESQTVFSQTDGFSGEELERGANRAGISDAAVEAAINERATQKKIEAQNAREKAQNAAKFKKNASIGGAVVAVALGLSLWSAQSVLSSRAARVDAQQASVETVLQRRHDLIPNLIAATKAAQANDSQTARSLETLLKTSQSATSPEEKARVESQLSAQISQSLAILNRSGSNEIALRLNDQLEGAENRISVERRKYNLAAGEYNRVVGTFPASLWRPILGYPSQKPLFQAEAGAKTAPRF